MYNAWCYVYDKKYIYIKPPLRETVLFEPSTSHSRPSTLNHFSSDSDFFSNYKRRREARHVPVALTILFTHVIQKHVTGKVHSGWSKNFRTNLVLIQFIDSSQPLLPSLVEGDKNSKKKTKESKRSKCWVSKIAQHVRTANTAGLT